MGQQSYVNPAFVRKTNLSPQKVKIDLPLLGCVFALLLTGILFVYSSSWNYVLRENAAATYILGRQLVFIVIGLIAAVIAFRVDYHIYLKWILYPMIVTLGLLIAVFIVGTQAVGVPTRALFNNSIQPSELAKLVIILYLAVWMNSHHEQLNTFTLGIIPLLAIVGGTAALIFMQPDISATLTVVFLGGALFYLSGSNCAGSGHHDWNHCCFDQLNRTGTHQRLPERIDVPPGCVRSRPPFP